MSKRESKDNPRRMTPVARFSGLFFICAFVAFALFTVPFQSLFSAIAAESSGNDPFSAEDDFFKALERSMDGAFEGEERSLDEEWSRMLAEEEARWKRLEEEVLAYWDVYYPPSKKEWVDYSDDRKAVNRVDFEKGKVTVEALVESDKVKEGGVEGVGKEAESAPEVTPQALDAVVLKAREMMNETEEDGKPIMEGMLPEETERAIDSGEIESEVVPEPVIGKDGVKRYKVRVELAMVPDRFKKRAERYSHLVEEQARKNGTDPALIYAIMHQESAFNPRARSHVPAYGLMQLVPRFGAKEAYYHLYGENRILPAEYLYDPRNNIELGVYYFDRLQDVYNSDVKDSRSRRYLSICSYNWGPTKVRNEIKDKLHVNGMSPEEVYNILVRSAPKETREYLRRVEELREKYMGSLAER